MEIEIIENGYTYGDWCRGLSFGGGGVYYRVRGAQNPYIHNTEVNIQNTM